MGETKRKIFSGEFKAKVALEAIRGVQTVNVVVVSLRCIRRKWGCGKKELLEQASHLFDATRGPKLRTCRCREAHGCARAAKKVWDQPLEMRKHWVDSSEPLALTRQCDLAGVARSIVYAPKIVAPPDEPELILLKLIDAQYTRHPFYGSCKLRGYLKGLGHTINHKRVQRLVGNLGLAGMAPGPDTSRPHPQHKVYPYLLRGVDVIRPNQVWSTDITYIRLPQGFVYLVAVIDWYSRKVLA